jgi:hypothetical protein
MNSKRVSKVPTHLNDYELAPEPGNKPKTAARTNQRSKLTVDQQQEITVANSSSRKLSR